MMVSIKTARPQSMNTDVVDYALPPDVFTLVQNGRPLPGSIKRGPVLYLANPAITTVPASSIGMLATQVATTPIMYFGYQASIQFLGALGLEDITRAAGAYTGGPANRWMFARFNNYIVATNGVDVPQAAISTTSTHADMAALSAYPASTLAQLIFAYKNFLVTANITKSGTRHVRLVKWSHQAATGLPTSWDETDPTVDAGENVLGDGDSPIVAAVPFQDFYLLYTQKEVWYMRFIGGQFIFDFKRIFPDVGALNAKSIAALSKGQHLVVTADYDIVQHDGNTASSVTTAQIREYIKTYLADVTEVFHDPLQQEVWICHASTNGVLTYDKALIWNYRYNSWSVHTLPTTYSTSYGYVNHPKVFRGDAGFVNSPVLHSSVGGNSRLLFPSGLYDTEEGRSSLVFRLERTGLSVKGAAQDGSPIVDYDTVAMFQEFRPRFKGTSGDTVAISFGVRETADDAVSFGASTNFTVGSTVFLPIFLSGRLLDIRMDFSHLTHALTLEGYDLDVVPLSRH